MRPHFTETQRYPILLRTYQVDDKKAEELRKKSKRLSDAWKETAALSRIAGEAIDLVKGHLEEDLKARLPVRKKEVA